MHTVSLHTIFVWGEPNVHSTHIHYDNTVHMCHFGRSGTLFDPPDTQGSIPHAAVLYSIVFNRSG